MAASTGIGVLFVIAVIAALAAAKGTSGTDGTDGTGGSTGTDTIPGTTGTAASTLVALLAEAIATAEGFFRAGSVAQRQNNPGNLTDSLGIRTFPDSQSGWQALYDQINLMFSGSSRYNSGMSLAQIGDIYADHDPNWAVNVAAYIGVPTSTTLDQLAAQYG